MWAAFSVWFDANKTKILEAGVMILGAVAILFAIWLSAHQRAEQAETIGRMQAEQVQSAKDLAAARVEQDRLNALLAQQAADIQTVLAGSRDLNDRLDAIRTETDRRISTINRHDLGKIGARKPKLLENRINTGTRDLFGRLRDLTK